MEDLISTTLSLVVVASLVALRLVASRKKKSEEVDRERFAQSVAVAAGKGEVFDAFALVPDEDEEKSPPKPAARLETIRDLAAAPHTSAELRTASAPLASVAPRTAPAKVAAPRTPAPLNARLERLTFLQRAVVFAEVLDRPKGLRDW